MVSVKVFWFLLLWYLVKLVWGADPDGTGYNANCPPSLNCGSLGEIHFPFTDSDHPDCGLFVIHDCHDGDPEAKKSIKNNETWFDVVALDQFTITVRDDDLHDRLLSKRCEIFNYHFPFPTNSVFATFYIENNVTLFKCNRTLHLRPPKSFSNSTICHEDIFYEASVSDDGGAEFHSFFKPCSYVQLPITNETEFLKPNLKDPFDFLSGDIPIKIHLSQDCSDCYYLQGGQCRVDSKGRFYCAKGTVLIGYLVLGNIYYLN